MNHFNFTYFPLCFIALIALCGNQLKDECSHVQHIPIAEVFVHENYDPSVRSHANDIALIRLKRPAAMNDFIGPICLPADESMRSKIYDNVPMLVIGFGRTEYGMWKNQL